MPEIYPASEQGRKVGLLMVAAGRALGTEKDMVARKILFKYTHPKAMQVVAVRIGRRDDD
jgi:hypothetical protein